MAPGITSSAALCTLTVSSPLLQGDAVLQLVLHLASDRQVKVTKTKKGNDLKLELLSGLVLTQRAAILRALAGPVLHYALDTVLLGGHSGASLNGGSLKSVLALSSLASWMTVAHQLSTGLSDKTTVLDQLESYLETKAFLIPSSQATLGDMELCVALLKEQQGFTPNVLRWLATVHAQMTDLGATLPPLENTPPVPLPAFFYGTEDFQPTVVVKKKAGGGASGNAAAGNKAGGANGNAAAGNKPPQPQADASGLTEEQKKAAADKKAKKAAM